MATPASHDASPTASPASLQSWDPQSTGQTINESDHSGDQHDAPPSSLNSDSDSSTSSLPRPNRYTGPDSTWRRHTSPERALATSLLQTQANDLSLHLYNTHAYKARLRRPASEIHPHTGKANWIQRDDDGKVPWHPRPSWSAWPMRAEDVPREREGFGVKVDDEGDGETFRKREAWRPTAEMEGQLLALMLRRAKEAFRAGREGKAHQSPESNVEDADAMEMESGREAADDDELKPNPTLPSAEYVDPDILADDEAAAEILQPMINHTLSQLDDLLVGLHKSRGERRKYTPRQPRSTSRPPDPSSKSHQPNATPATRSRKRPHSTRHSNTDTDSDFAPEIVNKDPTPPSQIDSKTRPSRSRPLPPRDWSILLATASLATGIPPTVLHRTAARCTALFGEEVSFHQPDSNQNPASPATNTVLRRQTPHAPMPSTAEAEAKVEWIYCPVPECKRKGEPFRHAWRWREHMKRVHGFSAEDVATAEAGGRRGANEN